MAKTLPLDPRTDGWIDMCDGAGALAVAGTWNYEEGVAQGGRYRANDADFTFAGSPRGGVRLECQPS